MFFLNILQSTFSKIFVIKVILREHETDWFVLFYSPDFLDPLSHTIRIVVFLVSREAEHENVCTSIPAHPALLVLWQTRSVLNLEVKLSIVNVLGHVLSVVNSRPKYV